MKPTIEWTLEKEQYIIDNYRILPNELIAAHLSTTQNIVRCRAAHLRRNGKPVAKYPIISWRKTENKEKLTSLYGTMPTHKMASILNTTVHVIYRAAAQINLSFRGNDGNYTFSELTQILKIDGKAIRRWVNFGLKIKKFVKDGRTRPKIPKSKNTAMRRFNALIDLSDLKKFLKLRPEAYNLDKLDAETVHLLELSNYEQQWKEKKMHCKECSVYFWIKIYNSNVICPKCKRFLGKWSSGEYRN